MHITKYRGRSRESEKPAAANPRVDPADKIVSQIVERLQPILTQPAPPPPVSTEEILRGFQEQLVHLAHRMEESMAKLLDDRAAVVKKALHDAAPSKSAAPDTGVIAFTVTRDVSQELSKQNEQLVQKFGSVLGRELAALSAQVTETVARVIPPDPNLIAGLVAQEVQTGVDASADKVRQAVAALAQALLEKIQAPAAAAPAPAGDLEPIREEISKAGKELRKDVWSIEKKVEELVNAELEKKLTWIVPGLVVDAVRDGVKAGMKPEEIVPSLIKPLRDLGKQDRKQVRKDVWSIEQKVERLVDAELEKKLTWIVPGLVVDAVRDGVKEGLEPRAKPSKKKKKPVAKKKPKAGPTVDILRRLTPRTDP